MTKMFDIQCDRSGNHAELSKGFIQPLAKHRGMRTPRKRQEFNTHDDSNQSFRGARIALKLQCRMIDVVLVVQASLNLFLFPAVRLTGRSSTSICASK